MGCGNNKVNRSYLSSQPATVSASDVARLRAGKSREDVRRADNSRTANAKRDQAREKAEKAATHEVQKADQHTPVAELKELRGRIEKNSDLSREGKQHLLAQIDRLIMANEDRQGYYQQLWETARQEVNANRDHSPHDTEKILSSNNFQEGLWAAVEWEIVGYDTAAPHGKTSLVSSSWLKGHGEPHERSGTLSHAGSGRFGAPTEVATLGELKTRDVETKDGNDRPLSLGLRETDQVAAFEKYEPGVEERKTIEGDIVIHRDGVKIAVDSKYSGHGELGAQEGDVNRVTEQLAAVVEAIASGRVDHFVFTTNGTASDNVKQHIEDANAELQDRIAQRRQELQEKFDPKGELHQQRAAQRDEDGNLLDDDGNPLDKSGWTSEELSHYARLVQKGCAPSISLVEGVGELL
jgi:hypothetical protein